MATANFCALPANAKNMAIVKIFELNANTMNNVIIKRTGTNY